MDQKQIDVMAGALRRQGLTWGQTNFAVSLARNAQVAERKRLAVELRETIALEGFGCACMPQVQCGVCKARSVLVKALTPTLKNLEA